MWWLELILLIFIVYEEPLKCVMAQDADSDSEENESFPLEKRLHLHRVHMKNWVISLDSTKYKVYLIRYLFIIHASALSKSMILILSRVY